MALEFVLAVASGLIVVLISAYFQSKHKPPEAIFEVTRRSEWTIQRAIFQDGEILQESTETRIEESTFKVPQPPAILVDLRTSVFAGVLVFVAAVLIILPL